ncbi:MAG: hypothetical protein JXA23_06235 [Bacteroidales bacterium]|nr:hypothetical protein [Bacteroidales bacterium]
MKQQETDQGKYSPEVEEILHNKPSFLVRNGIFLLVILVAILLSGACFIDYPETLAAPVSFDSCHASDSGICMGQLILTSAAASIINPGQTVQMTLHSEPAGISAEIPGTVEALTPIGYGDYTRVFIKPGRPEPLEGFSGTAYILIGKSNLLSKILNPVFAVFRSADH